MIITEGLKEGDLRDLVIPLVSIDEYETKLDDSALVLGFFVTDKDPAHDLNRFIQKGSVPLLDTDVSQVPSEEGYYVVFIELTRDRKLPQRILSILNSLTGLTGIKSWRGTFYKSDKVLDITIENLEKMIRFDPVDNSGFDEPEVSDLNL